MNSVYDPLRRCRELLVVAPSASGARGRLCARQRSPWFTPWSRLCRKRPRASRHAARLTRAQNAGRNVVDDTADSEKASHPVACIPNTQAGPHPSARHSIRPAFPRTRRPTRTEQHHHQRRRSPLLFESEGRHNINVGRNRALSGFVSLPLPAKMILSGALLSRSTRCGRPLISIVLPDLRTSRPSNHSFEIFISGVLTTPVSIFSATDSM